MNIAKSPLDAWLAARTGLGGLTQAGLERWQMAELRRTLSWARRASPFHAARLGSIDLDALRAPADLALLPRMKAADLAAPGLPTVSQDDLARMVSLNTSGSSGPAKRLGFTEADLERTLDFFRVGMSTLCQPGDAVLLLLPGRREWGVTDLLRRALPDIGARAVLPPEGWTPEELPQLLRSAHIDCMVAAPVQLRRLLTLPERAFSGVRAVLSSAERLPEGLREVVQTAWDCRLLDHWGMTETGYGGGVECAAASGYHLREADLLLEVADPRTGEPLPLGDAGEILVTTLGQRALPLLRYKTGDAARLLPGPCACGSPLRRLGAISGRLTADGRDIEPMEKNWGGWNNP